MSKYFWQTTSLFDMTVEQWESVCDGCGKCCLLQLEDETSGQLVFTDVVCDLLQADTCRCTDYQNRSQRVPRCMSMNADNVQQCAEFAPPSCSYRLLLEGKPLPDWHHLVSGSRDSVHRAGASVRGRVVAEKLVAEADLEQHVVAWPTGDDGAD